VSQAAIRASRRLRSRRDRGHEWPLTEATQDPTLQLIVERIKQIGLRSMTPARIYDLATEIGERYYRDLAADTGHEIKTLLTPLEGYLAELRRHRSGALATDVTGDRYLDTALGRLHQIKVLLDELGTYSSPNEEAFVPVDLEHVVREAVTIGAERAAREASTVELQVEVPKGLVIDVLQERLVRALANLVANAYQAMPEGGGLIVRVKAIGGAFVEVTVTDTGRGMTAEQVEDAMERFRSTRKDEGGTGLGLPIAERIIVQDHGGELTIESSPGEGTTVVVVLPLRHEGDGG
jgi:signal transduction histidine kinase